MNPNLLRRNLSDRRLSLLVYAAGIVLYGIFIMALWPSLKNTALEQLWESYPEGLKKAFGGGINIAAYDGFLTLEYFANMWIIIMSVFAIGTATNSLAGEIERGTMELLLAQPVSRRALAASRHFFLTVALAGLILATMIPIAIITPLLGEQLHWAGLLALSLQALLFFTAIGSYSFFFSAVFNSRSRAIFLSVIIIIFAYALDILAKLNQSVNNFHFLSIFNYYDPYRYLHSTSFAWGDLAVLAGIILVSTAAAVIWFERRDIAV